MADFSEQVLRLVAAPDYRPITLKAMSRRLSVGTDDYPAFRDQVKRLVKQGKLDVHKDRTLSRPDHSDAIVGIFRRSSRGFGFVRPHQSGDRSEQIYVSPDSAGDASSGDEVVVKVVKRPKQPGMNAEGRIVQILARASGLFVGTYQESGRSGYVAIDGTTFNDPIYVGDPGAKGAKPGDKVALEIVRYPTADREGEGVITELIGPRGAPGVDTLSVIRAFNIPDTFDAGVLEEAREQARRFSEDDITGREDFREILTVTIDPATARDFDDAISLSRDERGYWSLGVHIADVSHFVRGSTELDRSARDRGTSVYLPDRVIPMLPEVLSNSLASLQAGHVRYTVSALMEFDADGILTGKRFARSAIRVDRRFSYEQAMAVMNAPRAEHEGVPGPVAAMLGRMLELAKILRRRRMARGGLELSLPEVEIELGPDGAVQGAHLAVNDESHQVIEDFMIAANEAVASFLKEHHAPALRRVHADPEPHKLDQFAEFARSLGLSLELPQSRFELQRILRETRGTPEEYAVHFGLLRSMKQAVYTPEHEGHYALASEDYCHFTSPIRRYPDLQVHRQVLAILAGKKPKAHIDELFALGEHCTRTARRAEAAEREVIRVKLLTYLKEKVGSAYHAIVVGVEDFGLFCRLVEFPVEGLVHVTSLADDYYYLEGDTHTLVGRSTGRRHRLGDRIGVVVSHVDVDRRVLDLVLEDSRPAGGRGPAPSPEEEHLPPQRNRASLDRRSRPSAPPAAKSVPRDGAAREKRKAGRKAKPSPRKGGKKKKR
ncbi:Ribonuclease R [Aquisphaera giovannonii]|uniref:Ribonuclease R n=1 Tax=Aquisphaera giovannonii TaxID=406548 RepID=A0A5B9VYG5_9BACT|nr:ribonuclease R [Aquisphaera giovannonii]QEH32971.1 Ribonuclease R [Aquisphaera giovannonii]